MKTKTCDLLVIGTGAGGMSAAFTAAKSGLKVLMVEKEPLFGGATARSGGCLWIPNNHYVAASGATDTRESAVRFFEHEAGTRYDEKRVGAFLDNGPEMVKYVEANSPVKFGFLAGFPDYHCDSPGGSTAGRVIFPLNWDAAPLGKELERLRPTLASSTFLGMQVGVSEVGIYYSVGRSLKSLLYVTKCLYYRLRDQFRAGRTLRLAAGNALIGGLASAAIDNGTEIWTESPVRELIRQGSRVTGAIVDTGTGPVRVEAAIGVVLATGGFPHDSKRRAELFPHGAAAPEVWAMMPEGNSGDGIRLGESIGAWFDADVKSAVAMSPLTRLRSGEGRLETAPVFFSRGAPGVISVMRNGQRFVNEANSYHDWGAALLQHVKPGEEAVAWIVCDHRALRRYGLGPVAPGPLPYGAYLKSGYLKTRRDGAGSRRTGRDRAGRTRENGGGVQSRCRPRGRFGLRPRQQSVPTGGGDPEHQPNPNVGPLGDGPYYAIRVFAGSVGTFAGLRTDEHSRVLEPSGVVIEGLYAAGNDMASITGGDYIAGGCTIGPAMTFGYIAGKHAASLKAVS